MRITHVILFNWSIAVSNNPTNPITATVKWFDTTKGYGFILDPDGNDVFVHYRSLMQDGFKNLRAGDRVQYHQHETESGLQASDVSIVQ